MNDPLIPTTPSDPTAATLPLVVEQNPNTFGTVVVQLPEVAPRVSHPFLDSQTVSHGLEGFI